MVWEYFVFNLTFIFSNLNLFFLIFENLHVSHFYLPFNLQFYNLWILCYYLCCLIPLACPLHHIHWFHLPHQFVLIIFHYSDIPILLYIPQHHLNLVPSMSLFINLNQWIINYPHFLINFRHIILSNKLINISFKNKLDIRNKYRLI
jgi:hypothetical protein